MKYTINISSVNVTKEILNGELHFLCSDMFSSSCIYTFERSLKSVKERKKDVLVRSSIHLKSFRSSVHLKSFLNKRFTFFDALKIITAILKLFCFSHSQVHNFLFQDFFPNPTHIARIFFWFLETQGSTIDWFYIWIVT